MNTKQIIEQLEKLTGKKVILKEADKKKIIYPESHQVGIQVPKGGSDCDKCRFWSGEECENEYFRTWNGSGKIPATPDQYCCDFFEAPNQNSKFKIGSMSMKMNNI